jgi:hypothetical protein
VHAISTAGQRYAVPMFMAMVTCYLLGRVFAEANTGAAGAPEVVVYGATAAVGLEFLIESWRSLWRDPAGMN